MGLIDHAVVWAGGGAYPQCGGARPARGARCRAVRVRCCARGLWGTVWHSAGHGQMGVGGAHTGEILTWPHHNALQVQLPGAQYVLWHDPWSPAFNYALQREHFRVFCASSHRKSPDVSITILYIALLTGMHGLILGGNRWRLVDNRRHLGANSRRLVINGGGRVAVRFLFCHCD